MVHSDGAKIMVKNCYKQYKNASHNSHARQIIFTSELRTAATYCRGMYRTRQSDLNAIFQHTLKINSYVAAEIIM